MRTSRLTVILLAASLALTGCAAGSTAGGSAAGGATPGGDAATGGDGADLVVYVGRNEDHVRPLVEAFE